MDEINSRNPGLSHNMQNAYENSHYAFSNPIRSQSAAPIFSELKRNTSTNIDENSIFNSFNSMTIGSNLNRSSSTGIIGQVNRFQNESKSLASMSSVGQSQPEGKTSSSEFIQRDFSRISTQDYASNPHNLGLSLSRHSSGNFGSQNSLSDSGYRHDMYVMNQGGVHNGSDDIIGRKFTPQGNYTLENHSSVSNFESS